MVSARCQVHLGMLAKAHKFSRVLALQNSSKDDGNFKKADNVKDEASRSAQLRASPEPCLEPHRLSLIA